jgi:hypothetical protein
MGKCPPNAQNEYTMAAVSSTENEMDSVQQKVKQLQQLAVTGNGHLEVH